MIKGAANLYEMNMDCKITGKGLMYEEIKAANAMLDIMASNYTQQNTELIDINNMRSTKNVFKFSKMHGTGNDYIFIDNRESVCEIVSGLAQIVNLIVDVNCKTLKIE